MLDAIGQTGLGGSRVNKDATKGLFFLPGSDLPLTAGSGIALAYIDLNTGASIDPNLVPWGSSTKIGIRISLA